MTPATGANQPDRETKHAAGWRTLGLLLAVAFACGIGGAMLGPGDPVGVRVASLLGVWVFGGWSAGAYLLGAIGWGLALRRWITGGLGVMPGDASAIAACVGIAASLTVTHGIGVLGLLNPMTAWLWSGGGLALLVAATSRVTGHARFALPSLLCDRWCVALLALGMGGAGVMLAASAMPPGAQWDSEFGGYDSLSYHLQLPAEWMDAGRIAPTAHNVYSYLPGYMEAATVHMAHLSRTPPRDAAGVAGIASGSADGVFAPNLLALGMGVVGAWITGRFVVALLARVGVGGIHAARGACAAASLVLLTPWVQVVGSMAYNETGVIALGAAALLVATTGGLAPVRRGLLVAVLMGGAAGCKPTAVLFLAPACALCMAWVTPRRSWAGMFALGAAAGLLMLAPWMARNAAHGANPVFPQATSLFGTAHWTDEQAKTYQAGHTFDGSMAQRWMMLVRPDPNAAPNAPVVARARGLTNPQWALTPWLGLIGSLGLLAWGRTRGAGLVLLGGIGLGLVAWLGATHLQSRFLVPLVPLFAGGLGAGLGAVLAGSNRRVPSLGRLAKHTATAGLAASLIWSVVNYSRQRQGRPNELLALGAGVYTGALDLGATTNAIPSAWINLNLPGQRVLLVGDAAPLYYRGPIGYATVWDRGPLASAMRKAPDDPDAWTRSLQDQGYEWVLISYAEVSRLIQSGWSDPVLSLERIDAWAQRLGDPARVWPQSGSALFRLAPAAADAD